MRLDPARGSLPETRALVAVLESAMTANARANYKAGAWPALDHTLQHYGDRIGNSMQDVDMPALDLAIVSRSLDPDEQGLILATLARQLGNATAANHYFRQAETLGDRNSLISTLAGEEVLILADQNRVKDSETLVQRKRPLPEQASADWYSAMAEYHFRLYRKLPDNDPDTTARLEQAINAAVQALERDDRDMRAQIYLGLALEAAGDLQAAVDTLNSAWQQDRGIPYLNLQLSRMLARGNQDKEALMLLDSVSNSSHSPALQDSISRLRSQIENRTVTLDDFNSVYTALPMMDLPTAIQR